MLWLALMRLFKGSSKRQKATRQFLKYMTGGSLYFWSGYAIFALGYSVLHLWWLWAKIAADVVGWTLNYLAQRYWAFNSDHPRLSEMQHVARYLFIEAIGFILDYAIIAGLKAVGITPYIGFFISAGFFTIWSYLWYKYWVFPERPSLMDQQKGSRNRRGVSQST